MCVNYKAWVQSYRFIQVGDSPQYVSLPKVEFASFLPTVRAPRVQSNTFA